jgi:hypothetical protein
MLFSGVSPKPNSQPENNDQYRKTGDIKRFYESFSAGPRILQRIEALFFATHDRNVLPTVKIVDNIHDKRGIGALALGVQHIIFEHIGGGHYKDFAGFAFG